MEITNRFRWRQSAWELIGCCFLAANTYLRCLARKTWQISCYVQVSSIMVGHSLSLRNHLWMASSNWKLINVSALDYDGLQNDSSAESERIAVSQTGPRYIQPDSGVRHHGYCEGKSQRLWTQCTCLDWNLLAHGQAILIQETIQLFLHSARISNDATLGEIGHVVCTVCVQVLLTHQNIITVMNESITQSFEYFWSVFNQTALSR